MSLVECVVTRIVTDILFRADLPTPTVTVWPRK